MNRYVAMGTSISMGVASDGVVSESQQAAWPAVLAASEGIEFGIPLIASPGCRAPLVAPLANLRRADNSLISDAPTCADNVPGYALPEQNVAISGARVEDATNTRPATAGSNGPLYSRVLADGQTQVSAMRSMNPTFVSVEFGATDLLSALTGTRGNITSFTSFSSNYTVIINNVRSGNTQALLVLLPTDLRDFPGIRTAAEVASQRAAFAARNVSVNANCDASTNFVSLQFKILPALVTGAVRAAGGLGPFDLSCADAAGADGILTEADMTALNALAAQMNALIADRAASNGYATFSLGVLYDTVKDGVPFNLTTMLTSNTPFGSMMSLDGVHPSAAGQAILATAAKSAIIQTYGSITH
jgi:lysophospholipase L1-like esterase